MIAITGFLVMWSIGACLQVAILVNIIRIDVQRRRMFQATQDRFTAIEGYLWPVESAMKEMIDVERNRAAGTGTE